MARFKPGERRAWRVTLAEHVVGGRWTVAGWEGWRFEKLESAAKAATVRDAHIVAGVPPLRSLLRSSWPYVSALEAVYHPE